MKVGISGLGFVGGSAVNNVRPSKLHDVVLYDPKINGLEDNEKKLLNCEAVFMCLPTPINANMETGQDFSAYKNALQFFIDHDYKGVLIIKSTMLFSNIAAYLDDLRIVMSPEFLCANSAVTDFRDQKYIVLGGRATDTVVAKEAYESTFFLPKLQEYLYCSHKEAIELKYTWNMYHMMKVLWWNMVDEMTGNQRKIFDMYAKMRGTTESMELARLSADGRKGAGNACWIKDLLALREDFKHPFLEEMWQYNDKLRGNEV